MSHHVVRQNCISCVLGPLFQIGSVIGLPPIAMTCDHEKRFLTANIKSSKVHLCSSLFLVFLLICSLISCGWKIFSDIENSKNILEVLLRVPNFCIYLGSVLVIISARLQTSKIHRVCELLQDALENFHESKSIVVLTSNVIKGLRSNIYLHLLSSISSMTIALLLVFPYIENLNLSYLELIGLSFGLIVCYMSSLLCYHMYNVICSLYEICHNQLKCHLRTNLQLPYYNLHRRVTIVNNRFVKLDISESIACYTRLYSHIFIAARLFNRFLNPFILICMLLFIFGPSTVVIQYILRGIKGQPMFFSNTIRILHLETLFVIVFFMYFVLTVSKLQKSKDDIFSFFFKYPISRLFTEEAIQFEGYMRAVKHQELLFNVSDIFLGKLSIFATMFGGILALLCVALQFILVIIKT